MRLCFLLGLFFLLVANAEAQFVVPGSASPNGRVVLWLQPSLAPPDKPVGNQFLFRDKQTLATRSGSLEPTEPSDMSTPEGTDAVEAIILFDHIAASLIANRGGEKSDPAFTYDIAWSPDSQWVSIEGGEHKFWKALIYHLLSGRFERVMLSDPEFGEYFESHKNDLHVPDLGAASAIHKISPRNYDYPDVCWLGNGTLTINAYPYLLRNQDYNKLETHDFFFVVDVRTSPASITGFCK